MISTPSKSTSKNNPFGVTTKIKVLKIKILALLFSSISSTLILAQTPAPPAVQKLKANSDISKKFIEHQKAVFTAEKFEKNLPKQFIKDKSTQFDPINVTTITLKNGLKVMLSENHDLPEVFGMVVTKAGGKNDPKDATGLAHYLEHMLFKGTETMGTIDYDKEKPYLDSINNLYEALGKTTDETLRKNLQKEINNQSILAGEYAIANELDKLLSQIGGTGVNAFTTEDFTAYHNTFPSNQMEKWLELYSHRFEKPVFRLFQSELETVYEEKNRGLDNTFGQVLEEFNKGFYKVHPYGQQTIIGSTEHLKNPPLKKMYEYFDTYYVANNMALILAGDFNTNEIIPIIEEKFENWRTGAVPEFPSYEEDAFNGREYIEKKLTPMRVGILGFRSPANGHADQIAMDVALNILANDERTGLIDKLTIDGKIMEAGVFPIPYNDYGATMMFYIPKLVGQKLEAAEEIVLEAVSDLKEGKFSEEFLEAIKMNILQNVERKWENNQERVFEMAYCFSQTRNWNEYVNNYYKIKDLTKTDVLRVANTYFGDNYLCFASKMGFPKSEKLEKPGFKAVIPTNEVKSSFRADFEKLPSQPSSPKFVDFEKDMSSIELTKGIQLNVVKNPFNKIFNLDIEYGIGKYDNPILDQTAYYLSLIGGNEKSASEIKDAFYNLGASINFEATEERFICHITGNDDKLIETLLLYESFINNLNKDEKQVKKLIDDIALEQKLNRREPSFIAEALNEYAMYGNNSSHKRALTKKELEELTPKMLIDAFDEARNYETTFNYTGTRDIETVGNFIVNNIHFSENLNEAKKPIVIDQIKIEDSEIYLVNRKNAVQSQIYFNIEGKPRNNDDIVQINAFNEYFGGGMSSLVFQEIREFRSLAYSAYGRYRPARLVGKDNMFLGYIGCQGDKTLDALSAMMDLINNMPEKRERIDIIQSSLMETANTKRPSFRRMNKTIEKWQQQGYIVDPNQLHIGLYKKLTFEDITNFYKNEIQSKPVRITIVGDAKRFDMEELSSYGKIIKIKESELFAN